MGVLTHIRAFCHIDLISSSIFFSNYLFSDLTENLPTLRQFALVRKFRARALELKTKKTSKRGKKGIKIRDKKYVSMRLYNKLRGGSLDSLGEIKENINEERKTEKEKELKKEIELELEIELEKKIKSKIRLSKIVDIDIDINDDNDDKLQLYNLRNDNEYKNTKISERGRERGGAMGTVSFFSEVIRKRLYNSKVSFFNKIKIKNLFIFYECSHFLFFNN